MKPCEHGFSAGVLIEYPACRFDSTAKDYQYPDIFHSLLPMPTSYHKACLPNKDDRLSQLSPRMHRIAPEANSRGETSPSALFLEVAAWRVPVEAAFDHT